MNTELTKERKAGMVSATAAYLIWGILPLYWKLVESVPAHEVLAHRIIWSFVFMVLLLVITSNISHITGSISEILKPKKLGGIFISSLLISVNWFIYIWAVNHDHIIETSLGYYINPLISVLLGIVVLKEKLTFWQIVSFVLAALGVINMTYHFGSVPWVALLLAASFGLYGLSKKLVKMGAIDGITWETLMITPFALGFLIYTHNSGGGALGTQPLSIVALLIGAGVVSAVPLILFARGATRLPLSVIGFLQYIAPTIALIIGIFVYHEDFTPVHLVSFLCIWTALTIFSLSHNRYMIMLEAIIFRKVLHREQGTAK